MLLGGSNVILSSPPQPPDQQTRQGRHLSCQCRIMKINFFPRGPRRYGFIASVLFWNASNDRRRAAELVTPLITRPANRTHRPNVVLTMTINTKQPTAHEQFIFNCHFFFYAYTRAYY